MVKYLSISLSSFKAEKTLPPTTSPTTADRPRELTKAIHICYCHPPILATEVTSPESSTKPYTTVLSLVCTVHPTNYPLRPSSPDTTKPTHRRGICSLKGPERTSNSCPLALRVCLDPSYHGPLRGNTICSLCLPPSSIRPASTLRSQEYPFATAPKPSILTSISIIAAAGAS